MRNLGEGAGRDCGSVQRGEPRNGPKTPDVDRKTPRKKYTGPNALVYHDDTHRGLDSPETRRSDRLKGGR